MRIADSVRRAAIAAAVCCHPALAAAASAPSAADPNAIRPLLLVGESGSIGGKVGRPSRPAARHAPATRPPTPPAAPTAPAGPSIAGKWRWAAECARSGQWTGTLVLRGEAAAFAGTMTQDQAGDGGEVFDGHVTDTEVSFKRRFTSRFLGQQVQTWSGTLSDRRISGRIAYFAEGCTFTASR